MSGGRWTHYARLWGCPCLWNDETSELAPRWWWCRPWFAVAIALDGLRISVASLLVPGYEPRFELWVRPMEPTP